MGKPRVQQIGKAGFHDPVYQRGKGLAEFIGGPGAGGPAGSCRCPETPDERRDLILIRGRLAA